MSGELLHGDVLRDFEGELQDRRRRTEQPAPILLRRELIEGEIAANDGKCFGIFVQAFVLKTLLRKPAARQIAVAGINLAEPALIFPGTRSDENVVRRESGEAISQPLPVEVGRFVEE